MKNGKDGLTYGLRESAINAKKKKKKTKEIVKILVNIFEENNFSELFYEGANVRISSDVTFESRAFAE